REHQREAGGMTFAQEAPLDRDQNLFRRADADEPRHRHGVAVADDRDRVVDGNDLVLERHDAICARRATWRCRSRAAPATCHRRTRRRGRPAVAARYSPWSRPWRRAPAMSPAE